MMSYKGFKITHGIHGVMGIGWYFVWSQGKIVFDSYSVGTCEEWCDLHMTTS